MVIVCLEMKSKAEANETIRSMLSDYTFFGSLDFIPRQPITTDYSCLTTSGDPRRRPLGAPGKPKAHWGPIGLLRGIFVVWANHCFFRILSMMKFVKASDQAESNPGMM